MSNTTLILTLVEKTAGGHRYWYLRFYLPTVEGKRIQDSLYVGSDEEIVEKVRRYLARLGEEEREFRHLRQLLLGVRRLVGWVKSRAKRRPYTHACDALFRMCPGDHQEETYIPG